MLSTKFKVSFVKLSLEIRRGLKDILHTVVTSNLIIISREKSLVLKDEDGKRVRGCVGVCFEWGGGFVIFRDALLCLFLLLLVAHLNWHQTASNSTKQSSTLHCCEEGCRYFTKSKSARWNTWQNALWGWLQLRRKSQFFYPHHSLQLTPFFAPDYTEEKRLSCFECHTSLQELHWSSLQCKFRMSWCLCQEAQRSKDIFQPRGLTEV